MSARRYFGTDGVRGVVGHDLTHDLVERLGRAFAHWAGGGTMLVGRDTRGSGPDLERVLAAGLAEGGAVVTLGGVLPTGAVPLLANGPGAVVSASHNPPEYNGVKFFDQEGYKLSDADEEELERLLDALPPPEGRGEVTGAEGLVERYVDLVTERFGAALDGLRVALDCANGAMFQAAPSTFARLGASVVAVGDEPNGANINLGCGATDLSLLSHLVGEGGFDVGLAFDGDGDRVLAVDGEGRAVDGDQILALLALHLGVDLVAVTTMTNLGFHRLMAEKGIRVVTTDVGDRYVVEALRREGGVLGGEQSGHVIYLDGHTTGDGLVAAVLLARAIVEQGSPLEEMAALMPKYPQVKRNVRVQSKELPSALLEEVEQVNGNLGNEARILVRPSGTEPVVRVLAEAESLEEAAELCSRIEDLVRRELG